MRVSYDSNFWSRVQDYRLCWWFSNSNSTDIIELKMDAFSGEIVHYTHYSFGRLIFTDNINPLIIPISAMVFASISYLITRRKILKT